MATIWGCVYWIPVPGITRPGWYLELYRGLHSGREYWQLLYNFGTINAGCLTAKEPR